MPMATRVPDLLRLRANADPHAVALVVDDGPTLTYGRWDERSDAMARGLSAGGVAAGDRVALLFDNARWTDYAVCYLAVHKTGAVAVPLSPRFSPSEITRILGHAEVSLLVCPSDLAMPVDGLALADPQQLEAGHAAEPLPDLPPAGAGLAEIIYTSGTTGSPKGVACSHESILVHDLPPEAPAGAVTFAHAFPIGTNAGQECLRMPLRRPATAVVLPAFDPERLCALIAERGIERLQLVPAMAQVIVDSGAAGRHDVSSVERVTLSSAPAPPDLLPRVAEAFPQASVWNAYALTESGGARTVMRYDPSRPGSVGRPVGRTEVRVVDDAGTDLPAGSTGEVLLRRAGAPRREYYRDPAATAAAFEGDWLRTGDLGYLDEEGFLFLVDRKKDLVISGGLNISSVEVENALYGHPAVAEAAVFGVPHAVLGQAVAAAVVVRSPTEARDLQARVRQQLGEHKVPRQVFYVDQLPRNETGKVLKRQLRERFAAPPVSRAAPEGVRSDTEAAVVAVWEEILGRADIGVHDDFFDLGGQSLAAAQVVARLSDTFDVELPVTAVFERPTVAELAGAVEDALAETR